MKEILLKKLQITNFKGIKSLIVDCEGKDTVIQGDNGTGKTTVQDAFLWCLFGKDHTGRSDTNFSIKTWDNNHKIIYHLDHEVEATLSVNGNEITLKRCYKEKWGIGNNADKLTGHVTDYYKNGVKLETKKAYEAEVNDIIPEDVFRMIASPTYFAMLPAESQKAILFDMAGTVSDDEVASLNKEFEDLLLKLKGTNLAQFKKEIAAKKNAAKDELAGIPGRIDEVNRAIPTAANWDAIENEIKKKQAEISEIDKQIEDKSNLVKAEYERKSGIQKQIGEKQLQRNKIENEIKSNASSDSNKIISTISDLGYNINHLERAREIDKQNKDIISNNCERASKELESLRNEYRRIFSSELTYPEGVFVCPTCKRPLEPEDIESKQAEMLENFNAEKARLLKANQETGRRAKDDLLKLQNMIKDLDASLRYKEEQIENMRSKKKALEGNIPADQNIDDMIANDPAWIALGNEISELENQLKIDAPAISTDDLKLSKKNLNDAIYMLKNTLSNKDLIERCNRRIKELEEQQMNANQALSDLEHSEYVINAFQKAKDAKLLEKINGMFRIATFTFTTEQLNGNDKITCTLWVNDAPYADANSAGQINVGIDIINAICKKKEITAPIFVDNAESINNIIPAISQVINLKVSKNKNLEISHV